MNPFQSFQDKSILITGGTGSFGQAFIRTVLKHSTPKKLIVFSRDEWKQSQMIEDDPVFSHESLRFFLGDIRDKERLRLAFREVDYVIHAAALKQVPAAEYNPSEFIKTNIMGSLNVMEVAIEEGIQKVAFLSTDKAVRPINLYGASKLCAEKLFLAGKSYVGNRGTPTFCVVRYGNVLGSKGSLIPKWQKRLKEGAKELPITDPRMTRFWMTIDHAVHFVTKAIVASEGGEIFVPKIPSMKIIDLARALDPEVKVVNCGIRPGEKLHEHLITADESGITTEYVDHFVLKPALKEEEITSNVSPGFEYVSNENTQWMTAQELSMTLSSNMEVRTSLA